MSSTPEVCILRSPRVVRVRNNTRASFFRQDLFSVSASFFRLFFGAFPEVQAAVPTRRGEPRMNFRKAANFPLSFLFSLAPL